MGIDIWEVVDAAATVLDLRGVTRNVRSDSVARLRTPLGRSRPPKEETGGREP